ncbi:MAG: universal stress protein [Myxococcales bacterium]|nr:universal stress protein [Myxococcales bacterium]MCB9627566.1 universal stress protein [Sandaracinaceae bacterium]
MNQETKTQEGFRQVIVVAVDLSPASDAAVIAGVRIARPGDALHVIHTVESTRLGELRRLVEEERILAQDPGEIQTYFNDVCVAAGDWPAVKPEFSTCIGSPVAAILQFTVDVEAHVLVCGTHARHGLDRLLHSSVAETLVREARCPVLIAKERSYASCRKSDRPAPVCADCAAVRTETGDATAWCQVHAREHVGLHTYQGAPSRSSHPASFNISS